VAGVCFARALQQQVDYLRAENQILKVVIDIGSRVVEIAGIGRDPDDRWMQQMARNLVDAEDGFLLGKRYVLLDRDPLYTKAFRRILKASGVKVVRLPAGSPNLNAHAERFVLSIKSECLERIVPVGEGHLRRAIAEYLVPYHQERNHQGLNDGLIAGRAVDFAGNSAIVRRERMGELLSFYHLRGGVNRSNRVLAGYHDYDKCRCCPYRQIRR
jgi:putative transposase